MAKHVLFRPPARSAARLAAILLLAACTSQKSTEQTSGSLTATPVFNADSAYSCVERQVAFGPRVPNTSAHRAAGDYLIAALKQTGAQVVVQSFEATTFDGKKLSLRNIIASYQPAVQKRIVLAAHWDTRPFADKDLNDSNASLDGANDGASGVAVLLEMARNFKSLPPEAGIDLMLFDGEDWGERNGSSSKVAPPAGLDSWWCLGSQYWAGHKHKSNYRGHYGILLDMVGGRDVRFFREGTSLELAPEVVRKVWKTAATKGYGSVFVDQDQPAVVDDHQYLNQAGIPTIDIIAYDAATGSFGSFHHTRDDNMKIISKRSLKAVGDVLMDVVYSKR